MQSSEVRRSFLDFFARKGHQVVPSSPLVLPADPTLLFANAGMNQFKEVFRGHETRPYRRAASSQKCLRVSGKHNDLEEVGRTPRHHTFFEMLGNFSFGDYFKREAIAWGWELVAGVWKLPPDRLWVTVFAGDADFPTDEEAARLWEQEAGLSPSRVVGCGRKDNFWQMGDTGPAGPCTEMHVDMAPGDAAGGTPLTEPGRFLEIWNLVFMQYDLQPGGEARPLPAPCVDTGAGLERLTAVLSGAGSNYDTDLFLPILRPLAEEAKVRYGADPAKDFSLRVIADHVRAITMLVSEGVIPGPEKRGAVVRRILRRALRHGRLLALPEPFLYRHLTNVVAVLGEAFPELPAALPLAEKIVRREEERFDRTLADGFARLDERIDDLLARKETTFPGDEAFVLESERGLPLDLVRDALDERRLQFDEAGYAAARRAHVETSRVLKAAGEKAVGLDVLAPLQKKASCFVGRETLRVEAARVVALLADGKRVAHLAEGQSGDVVLDQTPFYAESGGQVGDLGFLTGADGRARVTDTLSPIPGVILQRVQAEHGRLAEDAIVVAEVDGSRRAAIRRHHTATHLLHAALRRILGAHVRQSGSLVAPDRLRFDFAHYEAVEREALLEIEEAVNEAIVADLPVETRELPLEQALTEGAIAFFGDRYGDVVRVVRAGDVSMELCGGTHVARTGEIGLCLVTSEKGIAAGVRRIEAVCGPLAVRHARAGLDTAEQAAERLGSAAAGLLDAVDKRVEALRQLQKENDQLRMRLARGESAAVSQTVEVDGVAVIARRADDLGRSQRRDLADGLRQKTPASVVVLGAVEDGKAALLIAVGPAARERVDARRLLQKLAPLVGGGGGGRPDLAEAGGKNADGVDAALARAADALRELLAGQ